MRDPVLDAAPGEARGDVILMYDELIERLRRCASYYPRFVIQDCEDAADAIEELQKQLREEKVDNVNLTGWLAEEHAKHLWIPVTERLPEKYIRVLVYSKATRMGRGIDFTNADGNWFSTQKVSHWMPLPEPPKEET